MTARAEPSGRVLRHGDLLDVGGRDHHADALQLAHDPLVAPPRILPGKPHDQCTNVRRDRWSTLWSFIGAPVRDQEPVPPESVAGVTTNADQLIRGNSRLAADRNTRSAAHSLARPAACVVSQPISWIGVRQQARFRSHTRRHACPRRHAVRGGVVWRISGCDVLTEFLQMTSDAMTSDARYRRSEMTPLGTQSPRGACGALCAELIVPELPGRSTRRAVGGLPSGEPTRVTPDRVPVTR